MKLKNIEHREGYLHKQLQKGEAVLRLSGKLHTGVARQLWKDKGILAEQ
jgi:hypothetical protein